MKLSEDLTLHSGDHIAIRSLGAMNAGRAPYIGLRDERLQVGFSSVTKETVLQVEVDDDHFTSIGNIGLTPIGYSIYGLCVGGQESPNFRVQLVESEKNVFQITWAMPWSPGETLTGYWQSSSTRPDDVVANAWPEEFPPENDMRKTYFTIEKVAEDYEY